MDHAIECKLCGKEFVSQRSTRKYCDECAPKQDSEKKRLAKAYEASKRRTYIEPAPIDYTCEECGKTFKNIPRLVHKKNVSNSVVNPEYVYFCSPKCKKRYLTKTSECIYCHKPLKDVPLENIRIKNEDARQFYCSEECREKQLTIGRYGVKICKNCGKEYSSSNKTFCSMVCKRIAESNGWKPEPGPEITEAESKAKTILKHEVCVICKRDKYVYYDEEDFKKSVNDNKLYICSKDCYEKLMKMRKEYRRNTQRA